jgi:hypothetical protein
LQKTSGSTGIWVGVLCEMTHSSSSENDIHSAGQKFPKFYEIGYIRVYKNQPLDDILSQMNPLHTHASYVLKLCFNIILLSASSIVFSHLFSDRNFVSISHLPHECSNITVILENTLQGEELRN